MDISPLSDSFYTKPGCKSSYKQQLRLYRNRFPSASSYKILEQFLYKNNFGCIGENEFRHKTTSAVWKSAPRVSPFIKGLGASFLMKTTSAV